MEYQAYRKVLRMVTELHVRGYQQLAELAAWHGAFRMLLAVLDYSCHQHFEPEWRADVVLG